MSTFATLCLALALAVSPQKAKSQKGAGFAGEWMTTFGPLELSGKGAKLSGEFGWGGGSKIEGEVTEQRFIFEWSGSSGRGQGWFELWKDGQTFTGKYSAAGGSEDFWGGYRKLPLQAAPKAGAIVDGQSLSGLEYHLRVPRGYDKKKRYTAVALLHGSNYNSRDYVEGFPENWPKLAERYILVGFDGEQLSSASREGGRAFNASYVEFSGDKVGEEWRYNQTPWLLAQALDQLREELPIERWYVGGHSQGGFLTLAMAMFYPDRVAGAFEVAGNLLVQCEPSYFSDEKIRALQRRVPIAIVHGEKDDVVEYSAATYTYGAFQDGGFPMLRLFNAPEVGHPWAFLPVDQALEWLDALHSVELDEVLEFAESSVQAKRWRDATAALDRARSLSSEKNNERCERLAEKINEAAKPQGEALAKLIAADKDNAWVDDFWHYREHFAFAEPAQAALKAYDKLRKEHERPAQERFYRARGLQDEKQRRELYREIVEEYYASSYYRLVKSWL